MAGDPAELDPFPVLSRRDRVHHTLAFIGPVAGEGVMDQHAIDVIRVVGLPEFVDHLQGVLRSAPDLGLDKELFSRQTLDGLADPFVSAIGLSGVDISDALIVGVTDEAVEPLLAEVVLDPSAVAPGAGRTFPAFPPAMPGCGR